jgi:hypothetical protein
MSANELVQSLGPQYAIGRCAGFLDG